MAQLQVPTTLCRQFTWDAGSRTLTAEASDLAGRGAFGRLYDDAADQGIAIESGRTGRTGRFVVSEEHQDREGDITHWTLVATPETARQLPEMADVKVVVFND